jgi:hypothetical protein
MNDPILNRTWAQVRPSPEGIEQLLVVSSNSTNGVEYRVGGGDFAQVLASKPVATGRIVLKSGFVTLNVADSNDSTPEYVRGGQAVYDGRTGGLRLLMSRPPNCLHRVDPANPPTIEALRGPLGPSVVQPLESTFHMTVNASELVADSSEGSGFAVSDEVDVDWGLTTYGDGFVAVYRWSLTGVEEVRQGRYERDGDRIAIRMDGISADSEKEGPVSLPDSAQGWWGGSPRPLDQSIAGGLTRGDSEDWSGLKWCGIQWSRSNSA